MRLLEVNARGELTFTKNFYEDEIPRFAILSHTWGEDEDEVTYEDVKNGSYNNKPGYRKIRLCGEQAHRQDLQYIWVDTCCIERANHAELAEAIVSMFRWYRRASNCYVFRSDVSARKRGNEQSQQTWISAFRKSRWFTRGWTLQELLAPQQVGFYSRDGDLLGDKVSLEQEIQLITQIPLTALRGALLSDFSAAERMRWASKRSTKRIEDKAYCLLGLFDVSMPPIYGEGEKAVTRLKDEIARAYRTQLNDVGYALVTSNSCDLEKHDIAISPIDAGEIFSQEQRKTLLNSLSFDQIDSRWSTIKSAYLTTCKWLLKHPVYANWTDASAINQYHGFLWINGKPGAGKSTMMKFLHANAERERAEHDVLISFFFNARGVELEKSTTGMYRALLYQLLKKVEDLQELLNRYHPSLTHPSQHPGWTIAMLCELFSAAITRLKEWHVKCFIDALDECNEQQVREMVDFFEALGQIALENGTQLYICFASRHYPSIDIRSGQHLTLESEHGHGEDLTKYVQSHLRAGKGKYIEEVRSQICEKANGVFMWAVLVVNILNQEFLRGRIFAVKKRLEEIPLEFSDLFRDILRRDQDNMTDFLLCLQWILFAKQPLRREEFYFAVVAGLDPEAPTVQFIHESVRDFLLKDNGLCELWPDLQGNLYSSSHERLKQCCQVYLNVDISTYVSSNENLPKASSDAARALRELLITKFPFLDYASRQILYHADQAAASIAQHDFLKDFPLCKWLNICNCFERYEIRRHTNDATALYILAENNCARLIKTICHQGLRMGARGERYHYPLFVALANGHREATRALLHQDKDFPGRDLVQDLDFGQAFFLPKNQTPFVWALQNKHKAVAERLITCIDTDISVDEIVGLIGFAEAVASAPIVESLLPKLRTILASEDYVLHWTVEQGFGIVVKKLVDEGTDIEVQNKDGSTALLCAAMKGHKHIVEFLLDERANIDSKDDLDKTALSWAAQGGHDKVVKTLLDRGARFEVRSTKGQTPLLYAAANGHGAIVELLLNEGADIEATDEGVKTALCWAVEQGYETVVKALLDRSAKIEVQCTDGWTPLFHAIRQRTPLFDAIRSGETAIVQLLLAADANFAVTDSTDRTPLLWAVEFCSSPGIEPPTPNHGALPDYQMQLMLLEQQHKKRLMMTLQYSKITLDFLAEVIKLLLANGASPNARGHDGKTALMVATERGWDVIVQILLDGGASRDAEDHVGRTDLLHAAESRAQEEGALTRSQEQ